MVCRDIMNTDVATCRTDATIQECASVMRDRDIGFVPIVDDDGVVRGTVTDRDIAIRAVADGDLDCTVADIMTKELVSCGPDDDLHTAETTLARAQKQRLLILDGDGRCLGVISLQDIVQNEAPDRVGEVLESVKQDEGVAYH